MLSIQALREQRAAKAKAINDHATKKDWNPAVDQPVWDAMMAEHDALSAQIKNIETSLALTAELIQNETVAGRAEQLAHDRNSPGLAMFAKWLRGGVSALTIEECTTIRNTLSTSTGSQGGFTVQTSVAKQLLDALKAFGGMRAVAEVFQTEQGNDISFPTSDGTSEVGELIGQNTTATGLDPTFAALTLSVYKYSSKVVAVPFELIQDSQIDVEAFVRSRLVTRLGRITNTHFTVGTGTGQPNGVITAAGVGVTAGAGTSQVTAITYGSLIDLVHSVDPAYRALNNCRFMMHDQSVKVIRKIVDGQQRPIFAPGYETGNPGGAPDRLLGYPIQVNQDVAQMAANAKSIAFGDFSFYKIRDVMDVTLFRFDDSAYAKLGQVGFLAWMRSGGNFIDVGGSVKLFVNAAT
ncbi:phage major capsid protein [Bradyrhizobium sp. 153]|uniref:phage major capsid protein n=1 Tax=Bradyrhizobium sp. 153 TaxID=2782627 RepID=UPI001FF9B0A1|nr:phage major capsid protein [Bradyrhizobium sp. 153]MCK1669429.1 phage major capsid protein [Bradyrhizobium sp. 153]